MGESRTPIAPTPPRREVTQDALAHLAPDGRPHLLLDHLEAVGTLARTFGDAFGSGEWAELAGRWHDLGKYGPDFQHRIRVENDFAAHIEGVEAGERDHSSAGALHACKLLGKGAAPLAFVIAGHHAGLSDAAPLFRERLPAKGERTDKAKARAPSAILEGKLPSLPPFGGTREERLRSSELWTRLVFSALCDADFLDTEGFYRPEASALRGGGPALPALASALNRFLDAKEAAAPTSEVNRVRAGVRAACLAKAREAPGAFSLTVPTGGGKTLASLSFALQHAIANGLRRVVVAIPFTSIIEQTAEVFRSALSEPGSVIEHHSALDPERETPRSRIATENWDAPVVVTTTVQLLESLLSNRPASCRKLHRLARSVIVLDEAQALRLGSLAPAIDVLRALVENHGASLVISTATQPAWGKSRALPIGFPALREIVPSDLRAFDRLRRVRVRWPSTASPIAYVDLAKDLAAETDVLAIVHKRGDARALCAAIDTLGGDESTVHLSALMCPQHRSQVLSEVREAKAAGKPVRLIATQLVEAGVDLDFPVVYRAMAGLDALAQAAGRCNREGRLAHGELRVFHAPTTPPPGVLSTGLAIARSLLVRDPELDLFAPETHRRYFAELIGAQDLDADAIQVERERLNFRTVAERFRVVDSDWSAPVIVPWGAGAGHLATLRSGGASRRAYRLLQRFIVNVPRRALDLWLRSGLAELVEGLSALTPDACALAYDERFGLVPERLQATTGGLLVDE